MRKVKLGILFGIIAGIIDVVPMLIQKLTWDANLSAFSLWIIIGFFTAVSDIKIKGAVKGAVVSLLVMAPAAILIGWESPVSLAPIIAMNLILGSTLGFFIDRYANGRK